MKNEKIVAGLINKAFATIFLVHNCQRRDYSIFFAERTISTKENNRLLLIQTTRKMLRSSIFTNTANN